MSAGPAGAAPGEDAPAEAVPSESGPDADDAGEPRKRPPFAARYPHAPEIDELLAAFEAGDYGTVRQRSREIAGATTDERIRAAALDLRRRIHPDPTSLYLLGIAVALLLLLYLHYLRH